MSSTNSAVLLRELISLSQHNPRYEYRRIHALLCRSGRICNPRKVNRLWAQCPKKARVPPTLWQTTPLHASHQAQWYPGLRLHL
ncbi:MAG: transposase [Deltaproteobacteria bacterium]|nr:MAG: transposase [Deltaproteobacteria bacterium]